MHENILACFCRLKTRSDTLSFTKYAEKYFREKVEKKNLSLVNKIKSSSSSFIFLSFNFTLSLETKVVLVGEARRIKATKSYYKTEISLFILRQLPTLLTIEEREN